MTAPVLNRLFSYTNPCHPVITVNIVMTSSRSNVHHGLNIIMLPITGMSLPLGMVCVLSIGYINFTTLSATPASRRGEEDSGLGDEVSPGGGIQLSHRQGR